MKTSFEEIVKVEQIGQKTDSDLNHLLFKASKEDLPPAKEDEQKTLLMGIDIQNDFMEQGALGVPGSHKDVENLTRFLYKNMAKITDICLSIDTHYPQQIFHPSWWVNQAGEHPEPFTIITREEVDNGVWIPLKYKQESIHYVHQLERLGKKQLCIWPYHCLAGTFGAALEGQFANLVYFHSVARQSETIRRVKGLDPLSEMYGIFKPEYAQEPFVDEELLQKMKEYDRIFIAGEAKSHCVLESLRQMLEYHADPAFGSRVYLLEDCMSCIPGFEATTEAALQELQEKYKINRVRSTEVTW